MVDSVVLDITNEVPLTQGAAVDEAPVSDKLSVIIDTTLGTGDLTLRVFGDLEVLMGDIDEYRAKLLDARGVPQDGANIMPDNPVFDIVEALPEVKKMPQKNRAEIAARNEYIMDVVRKYFARLTAEAQNSAIMLALTADDTTLNEDPEPYVIEIPRQRPGLITLPPVRKNLADPVERRLKQVVDRIVKIPGALGVLNNAIEMMSVDLRRKAQLRDRDGFRPKRAN